MSAWGRFYLISIIAVGTMLLFGCGPAPALAKKSQESLLRCSYTVENLFSLPSSSRGKRCVRKCQQKKSYCALQCQYEVLKCQRKAKKRAAKAFRGYRRRQKRLHLPVTRQLNSFVNFSRCDTTCRCVTRYTFCFRRCGGIVTQKVRCQSDHSF